MVFYGTFSTNRLYHVIEVGNVSHRAGENTNIMQLNVDLQWLWMAERIRYKLCVLVYR